ncbi:hypothetical protein P7M25_25150, partial [Vibrio parahaemolyticus]|nr:hypothetical protein [Vibrio parahaemolyticus]
GCNPACSKSIQTWLCFGEIMRGSLSALYDSEAVALELLKESDTGVSKQLLRKLAFNKSQMTTKVYRYKALNYLKK